MNEQDVQARAVSARKAVAQLRKSGLERRSVFFNALAARLDGQREDIKDANQLDLQAAKENQLSKAMVDRLTLNDERIEALITAVKEIDAFPDPLGVLEGRRLQDGMVLEKIQVAIGVVGFIYESRPNVTVDAVALCIKSGNAVLLKGGKEAIHSNMILASICRQALLDAKLPDGLVSLLDCSDRKVVDHLCHQAGYVDLIIPRGGHGLIQHVSKESLVPVIKHDAGNCHTYVESSADIDKAIAIVTNAKTQRTGVCNATESLVVDNLIAPDLLPRLGQALGQKSVELRCCPKAKKHLPDSIDANEADWGTEYLDSILSIKVVDHFDEAVEHISRYSSGHTEAIVTKDIAKARAFEEQIDSSVVMINASTRFSDGGMFGLGAEIGISTNRLHARGPMGAASLTTYKYVLKGDGQTRN